MKRTSWFLVLAAAACGGADPAGLKKLQPVVVLDIIGGANQVDTVGKELGAPIMSRVTDSATAKPIAGQIVNWVVIAGGGSVFAPVTQTDTLGGTQQRWTLGWATGDQVLEARAVDPTTGAPLTFARVHATALPRPTLLLVNERTYAITATVHYYNSVTVVTDTVFAASRRCLPLPAASDSGWVSWDGGGSPGTTNTMNWPASLGWKLTFNSNGGWGWLSGEPTCVP
jgi:hypothetical protein